MYEDEEDDDGCLRAQKKTHKQKQQQITPITSNNQK
jgi:hypothetical protein